MVLTKQDFLIKAGLLVAAVAVSSLQRSITMNPDGEALFHLGYLLPFVILVPIIAVIPGALFFGVAALTMDRRTRDHTRACFLMGLYVVALLMVCFNVITIPHLPRPPFAHGIPFWYFVYFFAFIYSLPGVPVTRKREERERKTKAEDERAREQRARDSSSNASYASSGRAPSWTHVDHYYRVLEIQPGATIDEVKAAYQRQMQQYHPDKVASLGKGLRDLAEAKSKEINEAYHAIVEALST